MSIYLPLLLNVNILYVYLNLYLDLFSNVIISCWWTMNLLCSLKQPTHRHTWVVGAFSETKFMWRYNLPFQSRSGHCPKDSQCKLQASTLKIDQACPDSGRGWYCVVCQKLPIWRIGCSLYSPKANLRWPTKYWHLRTPRLSDSCDRHVVAMKTDRDDAIPQIRAISQRISHHCRMWNICWPKFSEAVRWWHNRSGPGAWIVFKTHPNPRFHQKCNTFLPATRASHWAVAVVAALFLPGGTIKLAPTSSQWGEITPRSMVITPVTRL